MVIENILEPFNEWILPALRTWGLVILTLFVIGLGIGCFVAIVRNGPTRGLVITGRTLYNGVVDIFCMSPRRVWGLTWLSVRDSIRRRVLIVFLFFLVLLLFAGWFLDPGSDHPLRLYISFILTATSYLVLLLVLFLSAFSIPNELKNKTLHTVVTKPVRASEIVLGRMLGFTIVGTMLLVVMGLISYVFVVRGLVHTHEVLPKDLKPVASNAPVEKGKIVPLEGESQPKLSHKHDVEIYADGTGELLMNRDHKHLVICEEGEDGKITYRVSKPRELFVARVPTYGTLQFLDRSGSEKEKGINVGDEWAYRGFIAGGTGAAAIWSFKDISPEQFSEGLPVELTLGIFRTYKGLDKDTKKVAPIPGRLWIRNPKTGLTVLAKDINAKEFKTNIEHIPRKITTKETRYYFKEKMAEGGYKYIPKKLGDIGLTKEQIAKLKQGEYDIFEDLADHGDFEIWLKCNARAQFYGAAQADLYLHAQDASFALNFAKGYFGIWMQMLLLIGFGVMFSTFLSGPIATVATVGILIGGMVRPDVVELAAGPKYGGGPIESLVRILEQMNMVVGMEKGFQTTVIKKVDAFLLDCLGAVAHILPDFGSFSAADYVSYGFNVPGNWIAQHGLTVLGFFVVLFVTGYFFLKTREVAR